MTITAAESQVRYFVDRIERVEAEIAELNTDKSDIYKEARSMGFDVKALRKVVAQRKLDPADREERDAMFDLYWAAVHGTGMGDATRVHVHEASSYADEKGRGAGARLIDAAQEVKAIASGKTTDNQEQPETATERLDDLGPVQDGLKMSSDGQPAEGLGNSDTWTPGEETAGVTAGETATNSNSQASSSRPASSAGEIVPSSPISPAPPFDIGDIPACLDRRKRTDTGAHP